ncbi:MAG: MBL fold metallo-hydrolase, partial [Alphaproteobacteria bacterium]|nr:MBL fold metallo-hydrolase [Alphaproteobacteria bacterium]
HMSLVTLIEHLEEIAPKRLILTHMGDDMLERVKDLGFETAEDGKIVEI